MNEDELYGLNSRDLSDCINEVKENLKYNNFEYQKTLSKIERLKNKYPRIRNILDNKKFYRLNFKERKALEEIEDLNTDLLIIQEYEILCLGARENFKYLKRIGII